MAGYKETPRQKMISMMYLVLTALLALNVSREMLHAYIIVNESMETTSERFEIKVEDVYEEFHKQYTINPGKVQENWDKALQVKQHSEEIRAYIDSLKFQLIAETDQISFDSASRINLEEVKKSDNFDVPTNFFLGGESLKNGVAYSLSDSLYNYRNKLYAILPGIDSTKIDLGLNTKIKYKSKDGGTNSWEFHNFNHTILAAAVVILNKLKAEVLSSEETVVNYLFSSITKEDFKFDELDGAVIAESNYVLAGDEFKADVFVAAFDSKQDPEVYIRYGVDTLLKSQIHLAEKLETKNGKALVKRTTNALGEQKFAGLIAVRTPLGDTNYYHFKSKYMVAKPAASISLTKMNVFYRGVDNPITIAAAGVASSQIEPRLKAGTGKIVRDPAVDGGYIVKDLANNAYETTIDIYADGIKMGSQEFRIKRLPDPLAKVYGGSGDKISKQALLANPFLGASLPDYVDFEYKFQVTGFTMVIPKGGQEVVKETSDNNMFTERMKSQIQSLGKGDLIIFQRIKVKGPEGPRQIEGINIEIN